MLAGVVVVMVGINVRERKRRSSATGFQVEGGNMQAIFPSAQLQAL
jgi:hypothetical protein